MEENEVKRANTVFEYTTEELDLYETKMIAELTKEEYAIFRWGRESNRKGVMMPFLLGFLSGIIIMIAYLVTQ